MRVIHVGLLLAALVIAYLAAFRADAENEAAPTNSIAVRIGNPLLARFPANGNVRPRSVWDMHTFNGRIYIGSGDMLDNSGPTDVWTYRGRGTKFVKEVTVDEEAGVCLSIVGKSAHAVSCCCTEA